MYVIFLCWSSCSASHIPCLALYVNSCLWICFQFPFFSLLSLFSRMFKVLIPNPLARYLLGCFVLNSLEGIIKIWTLFKGTDVLKLAPLVLCRIDIFR